MAVAFQPMLINGRIEPEKSALPIRELEDACDAFWERENGSRLEPACPAGYCLPAAFSFSFEQDELSLSAARARAKKPRLSDPSVVENNKRPRLDPLRQFLYAGMRGFPRAPVQHEEP